ncbi:MAG: Rho termination factor N-terminal domain-containing protein, partial [Bacteroidota bacterium]
MFEISDLKTKKLPELQEIAKGLSVPKFKTLKKLDLVYQILDVQASNPSATTETTTAPPEAKPKRARLPREKNVLEKKEETVAKTTEKPSEERQQTRHSNKNNQPK